MFDWLGDIFGGGGDGGGGNMGSGIEIPPFYEDAFYKPSQDYLFDFGKNTMEGKINDYYAPIGEFGGSQFQKFMDMVLRDTTKAVDEDAIRRGTPRGGTAGVATGKAVADASALYGYQDYARAMEGRGNLLKLGTGVTEGVRQAGLTNQEQHNNYNLNSTKLALAKEAQDYKIGSSSQQVQAEGQGSWLDSIFGQGAGLIDSLLGDGGGGGMSPDAVESLVAGSGKMGSAKGNGLAGLTQLFSGNKDAGDVFKDVATDPQSWQQIMQIMAMSGCWVADEIYGAWYAPKTIHSRFFVNFVAPAWFRRFYLKNGKRIASVVKDSMILKALLRPLFEVFSEIGRIKMLATLGGRA